MNRLTPTALRLLLGLIFIATSLASIFQLMPAPTNYPTEALAFAGALVTSGYLIYVVWGVQLVAGFALVFNLWTPLALVLLAPVTVNILLFHIFLTPRAIFTAGAPGVVVFVVNVALLWIYRGFYRDMLVRRASLN